MNLTISASLTCSSYSVVIQSDLDLYDLSVLFEKVSAYEQKAFQETINMEQFYADDTNVKYYISFSILWYFHFSFQMTIGKPLILTQSFYFSKRKRL